MAEYKVKGVIIDDSAFFRTFLKDVCRELNIEVVEEFDRGDSFLNKVIENELEEIDLALLDINMPGKSGKDILEDLLDEKPELTIIMISTFSDSHIVEECLDLGASNYINKDASKETMKEVIFNTLDMNGLVRQTF